MARKLKNGNTPGSNELRGTLSRAVRLLEFLRKNTDEKHPISQAEILRNGGDDHIFGSKGTIQKYIPLLTDVMSIDEFNAPRPAEERRLKFKGSDRYYDNWGEERNEFPPEIRKIYYNHIFTEDELTAIINALYTSKAVSPADAKTISQKLIKNLSSTEHYKKPVYELDFSEPTDGLSDEDRARLSKNIAFLQKAIGEGYQISFEYSGSLSKLLNENKRPSRPPKVKETTYISPHYIVSDQGRLFLYGGFQSGKPCVFRVDLMEKIKYAGKGEHSRIDSLTKHQIGLPEEMSEQFKIRHRNGSYENDYEPVSFEWSCRNDKTGEFVCTALDGQFGTEYSINGKGEVSVVTSKWAMKIFALQYADYVKVTSPEDLVEDIAKTVRGLRDKYL